MSTPLRELQKVINSIVDEEFFPDEIRSGFFRQDDVRNNQGLAVADDLHGVFQRVIRR